ncbi:MAG: peptidoglycan bridge formation glycyltransferase FemA/FemB family protein [Treponema sp.]|nr:peptidoglycan bridge formation glycyltransferase FemA/FemB family protein [Treponema sp.]
MIFIKDIVLSDFIVCKDADSFLQSSMWGEFKSRFGWTAKPFQIKLTDQSTDTIFPLLVLCRHLAPGFSFAYVPWGPAFPKDFPNEIKPKVMAELSKKLKPFFDRNTVFIRFEPPWHCEENEKQAFLSEDFKKSAATVQAPDTVIINLNQSIDEILSQMKPKWRYNISLAQKKSVKVKTGDIQQMEIFYKLMEETARRDGIAIHGINYYKTLFDLCKNLNNKEKEIDIRLYTAEHEEDILAAIIVLFYKKDATYLYGASSNLKRNLMAPYALQWQVIQDAKEIGCKSYDLFGIPPDEDPNHPMAGLYRFKTGFGGQIVHRSGAWDYKYKPLFYSLFNTAEALRKKLRNLKKKKPRRSRSFTEK